ncbi:unnamed protein product [Spirodela intermedia]|uniref:Uncharacterized protein n=1 Tax=Spirodela intermedia TaxID=51605 RepID=A0A7I8KBF9_SPIIN|nr:unnamed protein product [Spirodela intermedia]
MASKALFGQGRQINEMGRRVISNGCDRSMKWVVESSLAAVTRRSGKTVTLRLSDGCHPTERSWMEVGRVKRRIFITSVPFSCLYDHSLSHNRLATSDMEGEWCTRAPDVT